MSAPSSLLLFFLLLLLLPFSSSAASSSSPEEDVPYNTTLAETPHDKLADYGLPKGLLPSSAASPLFSLAPSSGLFLARLPSPCYLPSFPLYYSRQIRGRLSQSRISELSGLQIKRLFFWVSVSGIEVDVETGTVMFDAGLLSLVLPIREFEMIPRCRGDVLVVEEDGGEFPCRESMLTVTSSED